MKTIIIQHSIKIWLMGILIFSGPFSVVAQNSPASEPPMSNQDLEKQHKNHDSFSERFAHKGYILLLKKYQLPQEVRDQLREVVNAYLEMKEALVKDDPDTADHWAKEMENRIQAVDRNLIEGEGLRALNQHTRLLKENLQHFQHTGTLYQKRTYFSHISEIVYCTVKSFHLDFEELYSLYCPMAFSSNGGDWLSLARDTRNPYFGKTMDDCGKISSEFLGTRKTTYISPFGRRKKH